MEHACYRCGGPVEDQMPFCPACGAPQIKVSVRSSEAVEAESVNAPPAAHHLTDPSQIQWRRFLGIALSLAPVTGFSMVALFPLGCVLLAGSVVWSIHRYRRRHLGPLTGLQGAKLGASIGLLSAGFSSVFFVAQIALDPAAYRQALHEFVVRNPSAQAQQIAPLLGSNNGLILITVAFLMVLSVMMLIMSAMIGALAASLGRNRLNP